MKIWSQRQSALMGFVLV